MANRTNHPPHSQETIDLISKLRQSRSTRPDGSIEFQRYSNEVKEQCRFLCVEKGMTITQIALLTGISEATMRNWSREQGDWPKLRTVRLKRKLEADRIRLTSPVVPIEPALPEPKTSGESERVQTILRQIERLDREIDSGPAQLLPRLVEAKAKLWALIHPRPGSLKPKAARKAALEAAALEPVGETQDFGLGSEPAPLPVVSGDVSSDPSS